MKRLLAGALALLAVVPGRAGADGLDLARSRITIHVYKSGLFSAFADNHIIEAKPYEGSLTLAEPSAVSIGVHAADLRVLDPGLAAGKRQEVQTRMVGPEVLDAAAFPQIKFTSISIQQSAPDRWHVTGNLTIHGQTRSISFDASRSNGMYRGSVRISQRDFGITPISIVGGTVRVKDELLIEFEVAGAP